MRLHGAAAVLAVLIAGVSGADAAGPADALIGKFETSPAAFSFTCKVMSDPETDIEGRAVIDGGYYEITAGSVEIHCDSSVRVTLNRDTREAYLENPDGAVFFWTAPVLFLPDVDDLEAGPDWLSGTYVPETDEGSSFPVRFRLYDIVWGAKGTFSFDVKALGKDWVVTDLR